MIELCSVSYGQEAVWAGQKMLDNENGDPQIPYPSHGSKEQLCTRKFWFH
jgi:hypothetical protein